MQYTLMFYESTEDFAARKDPEKQQAYMAGWSHYVEEVITGTPYRGTQPTNTEQGGLTAAALYLFMASHPLGARNGGRRQNPHCMMQTVCAVRQIGAHKAAKMPQAARQALPIRTQLSRQPGAGAVTLRLLLGTSFLISRASFAKSRFSASSSVRSRLTFKAVPSLNRTLVEPEPEHEQPLLQPKPQPSLIGTIAFLFMNPLAESLPFLSHSRRLARETPFTCLPKDAVSLLLARVSDTILIVARLHAFYVMFKMKSETPRPGFVTSSTFALKMPSCLERMLAVAKRVVVPLTVRNRPGTAITPSIGIVRELPQHIRDR